MRGAHYASFLATCVATGGCNAQAQALERDTQYQFSVSRPASWFHQDKPFPAIRVMLGIEGDGYVGNCNVSVLPSPRTAKRTQQEVDNSENRRALGITFFQSQLQAVAQDVEVLAAVHAKRGQHFGHLVNYTYSYVSPTLQKRVHIRAELFSHSRPGKVFSFTCNTGALTPVDAQRAFTREAKSFEQLSASLRVDA